MEIKLMHDSITEEEVKAINECLDSGFYTQGKLVEEFESKFAAWNGSKYAVMVNSGSSANLLMVQILKDKYGIQDGDEVLVPAVTWPTTIYPLIQNGLRPVFCDVDESFNISLESMKRMLTEKTKALFLVHLLGQPADLEKIIPFCQENKLVLIEDSCESLGAEYQGVKVGNFGKMSSFSFYFGHHMTTIEGGMITTDDEETYDLLKSIRSHGWVRGSQREEKYQAEYGNTHFIFDRMGYNLRSTNINAAIGLIQLQKLDQFIVQRKKNHALFKEKLLGKIKMQKVFLNQTSSFALAIILDSKEMKDFLLKRLPTQGIECRPIVAGNLLRQPVFKDWLRGKYQADECVQADIINDRGLYLPNNQFIGEEEINYIIEKLEELLNGYDRPEN